MVASLPTFLPPLVAAAQNIALFGLVAVVSVTAFVELVDRWADQ